jgi:BMFP domain-containing protein YqiC
MPTENPLLDRFAKLLTGAADAAEGLRAEVDGFVKMRLEKLVADMNVVSREEFEVVKAMAAKARAENDALSARLSALEKKFPPDSCE